MTERQIQYRAYFKDPRWQRKRLEILERDDYTCQNCFDSESTLHVHHRYYEYDMKPWEYPLSAFLTLCEGCHEGESADIKSAAKATMQSLRKKFMSRSLSHLSSFFDSNDIGYPEDLFLFVMEFWFKHPKGYKSWKKLMSRTPMWKIKEVIKNNGVD